jgi:hypothetical protein
MHKKISPQLPRALLICFVLGSAGCVTPRFRGYEGSPRSNAEIAVVKVQFEFFKPSARIESIDGRLIQSKGHWGPAVNIKELELTPGTHTLEVSYFDGPIISISNASLTFNCKTGGVYELHVAPVDEGFARALAVGAGGKGHWTAWIIDAETKEILAGKPRTEPARWYEK